MIHFNITPDEAIRLLMAQGDMQPAPQASIEASNAAILAIAAPFSACPGCWYAEHPGEPFPIGVSSATCPDHAPVRSS